MELFLPGIIVILLSAFFVFLVVPRIGSTILAVTSVVALMLVAYNHMSVFASEYKLSTWQLGAASSGPWIVVFLAFLFIIAAVQWIYASPANSTAPIESIGNSISSSINTMPSANSATNPLTAAVNNGIKSLSSNFAPKNNSPVIPGLNFKASSL